MREPREWSFARLAKRQKQLMHAKILAFAAKEELAQSSDLSSTGESIIATLERNGQIIEFIQTTRRERALGDAQRKRS